MAGRSIVCIFFCITFNHTTAVFAFCCTMRIACALDRTATAMIHAGPQIIANPVTVRVICVTAAFLFLGVTMLIYAANIGYGAARFPAEWNTFSIIWRIAVFTMLHDACADLAIDGILMRNRCTIRCCRPACRWTVGFTIVQPFSIGF